MVQGCSWGLGWMDRSPLNATSYPVRTVPESAITHFTGNTTSCTNDFLYLFADGPRGFMESFCQAKDHHWSQTGSCAPSNMFHFSSLLSTADTDLIWTQWFIEKTSAFISHNAEFKSKCSLWTRSGYNAYENHHQSRPVLTPWDWMTLTISPPPSCFPC